MIVPRPSPLPTSVPRPSTNSLTVAAATQASSPACIFKLPAIRYKRGSVRLICSFEIGRYLHLLVGYPRKRQGEKINYFTFSVFCYEYRLTSIPLPATLQKQVPTAEATKNVIKTHFDITLYLQQIHRFERHSCHF